MRSPQNAKKGNFITIARYISEHTQASNSEIANSLRMSMPTVLQHVKELLEQGVIEEEGKYESSGGRRASYFTLRRDLAYVIGLDIRRESMIFSVINMRGESMYTRRFKIPYEDSFLYFDQIRKNLNEFLDEAKISRQKVCGIGISLPGIVDDDKKFMLRSHALNVKNVSFLGLERILGYPIMIENDANCAAFAELHGYRGNAVYLSLSDTVGGAICMDGVLYKGDGFKSGEFGHMVVNKDGETCYCGKRGCFDAYCSAKVLKKAGDGELTVFFDKVKNGEQEAVAIWEKYSDYLALAVSNLRMVFDCDVVLGGEVGGYLEKYQFSLMERTNLYNKFEYDTEYLKIGKYKNEVSAYGAALRFRDDIFDDIIAGTEEISRVSV